MSTEYKITEFQSVSLLAYEHSGVFDLDVEANPSEAVSVSITVAKNLTPNQLANTGLRLIEVASYNCADRAALRERCLQRLNSMVV